MDGRNMHGTARVIAAVVAAVLTGLASTGCFCALAGQDAADRGAREGTQSGQKAAQPTKPGMLSEHEAMDQIVGTVLEGMYGDAEITQVSGAADGESFITLYYDVKTPPVKGDGERLLAVLLTAGATEDPAIPGLDYHYGSEEMVVQADLGNPEYPKMKISLTPNSKTITVNAIPKKD